MMFENKRNNILKKEEDGYKSKIVFKSISQKRASKSRGGGSVMKTIKLKITFGKEEEERKDIEDRYQILNNKPSNVPAIKNETCSEELEDEKQIKQNSRQLSPVKKEPKINDHTIIDDDFGTSFKKGTYLNMQFHYINRMSPLSQWNKIFGNNKDEKPVIDQPHFFLKVKIYNIRDMIKEISEKNSHEEDEKLRQYRENERLEQDKKATKLKREQKRNKKEEEDKKKYEENKKKAIPNDCTNDDMRPYISESCLSYVDKVKKSLNQASVIVSESGFSTFYKIQCTKINSYTINDWENKYKNVLEEHSKNINKWCGQLVATKKKVMSTVCNFNSVMTSVDPDAKPLIMKYIGERILISLNQADSTEVIYAFANVVVSLFTNHQDFVPILLYTIYDRCPYAVPMYPIQKEGESDHDFYIQRLKYNFIRIKNEMEGEEKYYRRMESYIKFVTMLSIVSIDVHGRQNKSFPIENAWRWISRILNLGFMPITTHLINAFLECGAYALSVRYGNQFAKIINLIRSIDINDPAMNIARTKIEDYLKKPKFTMFMS